MQTITKNQIQSSEFDYRYLETDGNGGFISQTVTSANTRNEDSLYTVSLKAPIRRFKLVQKFDEQIIIDDKAYNLSSQPYVNCKNNTSGKDYIVKVVNDYVLEISMQVADVVIIKNIVFSKDTSQVAIKYQIINQFNRNVQMLIRPQIAGYEVGGYKAENEYDYQVSVKDDIVQFKSLTCQDIFIKSNSQFTCENPQYTGDYYYPHDSRDGRNAIGTSQSYGQFKYSPHAKLSELEFILSIEPKFPVSASQLIANDIVYKQQLVNNSQAKSDFTKSLALATDNYLVNRESTGEKTIIAGYPFFGDWGRDTFWAFNGTCLQTKRYAEAKSILRSFIKYEQNGLIPNMFPEGDEQPLYNSVDAPLLFINSVYEYYLATEDKDFILEVKSTIENMINNYIEGTDYHIYMDNDGLIASGADLEQLTWMDIRFDQILPTPRHGKCVEINSMWYNALKIVQFFQDNVGIEFNLKNNIADLSELVATSFRQTFIMDNGYLKDVISNTYADTQIRSNGIWAVTQNFSPLQLDEMKAVVKVASSELYTSLGIRTLSPSDVEFKAKYGDSHFERDMAYHQGTVWPFILGGYIRAYLKSEQYSGAAKEHARHLLAGSEQALSEYCIGQICEVLDGLNPSYSKGCYAQAWSIAEIYRAANEVEE